MIVVIAAVSEDGYIGKGGKIPWSIPEDLRRFRELTMGHPVIMGRKTWESLPRKPLEGRLNYVVTRQRGYRAPGAVVSRSLEHAIMMAESGEPLEEGIDYREIYIIGGGEIYRQAMEYADRLEITLVRRKVSGDVKFPEIGEEWKEVARVERGEYAFITYEQ